jgi:hypothetical protein
MLRTINTARIGLTSPASSLIDAVIPAVVSKVDPKVDPKVVPNVAVNVVANTVPTKAVALLMDRISFLSLIFVLIFVFGSGVAQAQTSDYLRSSIELHQGSMTNANERRSFSSLGQSIARPFAYLHKVQASERKSRRQVIEEVERAYQAKVLKVSFDREAGVYDVRILLDDGRVRTIRVSAYG